MTESHIEKVKIQRFINKQLKSNSYILYCDEESSAWIVDPGDVNPLVDFLNIKSLSLKGILLTHSHYDHIYGLNDLRVMYRELLIYASENSKEYFSSAKLNGSLYAEIPLVVDLNGILFVKHGDVIQLWKNVFSIAYVTPGHNDDCITYFVENNLFTGDTLIPGIKVHLKAKKANKKLAHESVRWIMDFFDKNVMIYPGHLNKCELKDTKILF